MTQQMPSLQSHYANMKRVDRNIRHIVLDFCSRNVGRPFSLIELEIFVMNERKITPGSPGRILRLLKQERVINYQQLSRHKSKYQITYIRGFSHQTAIVF